MINLDILWDVWQSKGTFLQVGTGRRWKNIIKNDIGTIKMTRKHENEPVFNPNCDTTAISHLPININFLIYLIY